MSKFDIQYQELIKRIDRFGYSDNDQDVRPKWHDGTPAHTTGLLHQSFTFTADEFPILTQKKVAWKTGYQELRWIWQLKSNKLEDAHKLGIKYWDDWDYGDGTIGKAYGAQLGIPCRLAGLDGKPLKMEDLDHSYSMVMDQVDSLIFDLKNNPYSRRHITEIWIPNELVEMALTPCVHLTQWFVQEDRLYLNVRCRSNDAFLGLPINVSQYYMLWAMIAQVTGYKLGEMYYDMANVHVYDRHWGALREQFKNTEYEAPKLWINPEIHNFYEFGEEDIKLVSYKHSGVIKAEVAI